MMSQSELFVGLMSGTSLDGVDGVLADFGPPRPQLLAHAHHGFAPDLRATIERLMRSGDDELHHAAVASQHLARAYASVVQDVLLHANVEPEQVRAIGVHGQTVRHRPDEGYTLQLNSPATLAELTRIDVVADLRSRDVAAGGQGAPLVPAFHVSIFTTDTARAVVNIGGMSNATGIPARGGDGSVIGFDCGPGTVLIDAWASRHLREPFDRDGRWAASGHTHAALLESFLAEPYLALSPPKSTGRDLFNPEWLGMHLDGREIEPKDVQATLTRLTARTIGQSIARFLAGVGDVIVCGGGALNATLMRMLAEECAPRPITSSAALGIDPQHVEALAFAWLAREHLARRPGNVPTVTGARGARVLGALYPAGQE
jgi:anhydro-N-acetylmuramic acid kinase